MEENNDKDEKEKNNNIEGADTRKIKKGKRRNSRASNEESDKVKEVKFENVKTNDEPGPSKPRNKNLKRKCGDDEEESGEGGAGSSSAADTDPDDKDPSKDKKKKNRCAVCRKKVGLTGFECRCGGLFCAVHRYSDKHDCSFDYRELGAQEIRRNNPVVVSQKIHKI